MMSSPFKNTSKIDPEGYYDELVSYSIVLTRYNDIFIKLQRWKSDINNNNNRTDEPAKPPEPPEPESKKYIFNTFKTQFPNVLIESPPHKAPAARTIGRKKKGTTETNGRKYHSKWALDNLYRKVKVYFHKFWIGIVNSYIKKLWGIQKYIIRKWDGMFIDNCKCCYLFYDLPIKVFLSGEISSKYKSIRNDQNKVVLQRICENKKKNEIHALWNMSYVYCYEYWFLNGTREEWDREYGLSCKVWLFADVLKLDVIKKEGAEYVEKLNSTARNKFIQCYETWKQREGETGSGIREHRWDMTSFGNVRHEKGMWRKEKEKEKEFAKEEENEKAENRLGNVSMNVNRGKYQNESGKEMKAFFTVTPVIPFITSRGWQENDSNEKEVASVEEIK